MLFVLESWSFFQCRGMGVEGEAHIENILRASKTATTATTTGVKHLPVIQLYLQRFLAFAIF